MLAVADIWGFLLTPPCQLLRPFVKPPNISHLPAPGFESDGKKWPNSMLPEIIENLQKYWVTT